MSDEKYYRQYAQSGIGQAYWELTLDDYQLGTSIVKLVETYILSLEDMKKKGLGLGFHGKIGTGKSMLGLIVLKEAIKRGYHAHSLTLDDIADLYWSRNKEEVNSQIQSCLERGSFLLLDDIPHMMDGRYDRINLLGKVVKKRVEDKKVTLYTTKLSLKELEKVLGRDLFSVLKRGCIPIEIEDYSTILSDQNFEYLLNKTKKARKS